MSRVSAAVLQFNLCGTRLLNRGIIWDRVLHAVVGGGKFRGVDSIRNKQRMEAKTHSIHCVHQDLNLGGNMCSMKRQLPISGTIISDFFAAGGGVWGLLFSKNSPDNFIVQMRYSTCWLN